MILLLPLLLMNLLLIMFLFLLPLLHHQVFARAAHGNHQLLHNNIAVSLAAAKYSMRRLSVRSVRMSTPAVAHVHHARKHLPCNTICVSKLRRAMIRHTVLYV